MYQLQKIIDSKPVIIGSTFKSGYYGVTFTDKIIDPSGIRTRASADYSVDLSSFISGSGLQGPPGPSGISPAIIAMEAVPDDSFGDSSMVAIIRSTGDVYTKISGHWTYLSNMKGPSGDSISDQEIMALQSSVSGVQNSLIANTELIQDVYRTVSSPIPPQVITQDYHAQLQDQRIVHIASGNHILYPYDVKESFGTLRTFDNPGLGNLMVSGVFIGTDGDWDGMVTNKVLGPGEAMQVFAGFVPTYIPGQTSGSVPNDEIAPSGLYINGFPATSGTVGRYIYQIFNEYQSFVTLDTVQSLADRVINLESISPQKGDTGPSGVQGLKGDTGDIGSSGISGVKGDQGEIGPSGLKGDIGSQGNIGLTGPSGLMGIQGIQGNVGPSGSQGIVGPSGLQGLKGDKGDKGDTGSIGPSGLQGLVGPSGNIGLKGDQGIQGVPGPSGNAGSQGLIGPSGSIGLQGLIGLSGSQGIPGPSGSMGPQGLVGPSGSQGSTGPSGATGSQGQIGPSGLQGLIGLTGPSGQQGIQGISGIPGIIFATTPILYDSTTKTVSISVGSGYNQVASGNHTHQIAASGTAGFMSSDQAISLASLAASKQYIRSGSNTTSAVLLAGGNTTVNIAWTEGTFPSLPGKTDRKSVV